MRTDTFSSNKCIYIRNRRCKFILYIKIINIFFCSFRKCYMVQMLHMLVIAILAAMDFVGSWHSTESNTFHLNIFFSFKIVHKKSRHISYACLYILNKRFLRKILKRHVSDALSTYWMWRRRTFCEQSVVIRHMLNKFIFSIQVFSRVVQIFNSHNASLSNLF